MKHLIINALGKGVNSVEIKQLLAFLKEDPIINDKPPLSDESYNIEYEFCDSGILLGFTTSKILEYVFIYYEEKFDYSCCNINILPNIFSETTKETVLKIFGEPVRQRAVKKSILGHIPDWILYDFGTYCLHFQFGEEDAHLMKMSFILSGYVPGYKEDLL